MYFLQRAHKFSAFPYRLLLSLFFLSPSLLHAHAHGHLAMGFSEGFVHPFTGLDHSLAMIGVGLLASRCTKVPPITLPLLFIACMLIGSIVGLVGTSLPWIELGIVLSVFIFGLMLALPKQLPIALIMLSIFVFAFCHGHAHGYEMHAGLNAYYYGGGFLLATMTLHAIGFGLGMGLNRAGKWMYPATGLAMILSSFWV